MYALYDAGIFMANILMAAQAFGVQVQWSLQHETRIPHQKSLIPIARLSFSQNVRYVQTQIIARWLESSGRLFSYSSFVFSIFIKRFQAFLHSGRLLPPGAHDAVRQENKRSK